MQGTIAQIVALTTHGNAFLLGVPTPDFYPTNSTFSFCEYVRFSHLQDSGAPLEEARFADHPVSWFERMRNEGVYALRMIYVPSGGLNLGNEKIPDRMLVGLIGGEERWLIQSKKKNGSDSWEVRWQVGDQTRADKRIWQVTYRRIAINQPSFEEAPIHLGVLSARLRQILIEIIEFARVHHLNNFAQSFESGLRRLASQAPLEGLYHTDLAPAHFLSLEAEQLLAAAQAAWVFGAMCSWNDLSFEGEVQTRYEHLSEELYQILNQAIVIAVNSGSPDLSRERLG